LGPARGTGSVRRVPRRGGPDGRRRDGLQGGGGPRLGHDQREGPRRVLPGGAEGTGGGVRVDRPPDAASRRPWTAVSGRGAGVDRDGPPRPRVLPVHPTAGPCGWGPRVPVPYRVLGRARGRAVPHGD